MDEQRLLSGLEQILRVGANHIRQSVIDPYTRISEYVAVGAKALDAPAATFFDVEEYKGGVGSTNLIPYAVTGPDEILVRKLRLPRHAGVAGAVLSAGEPKIENDPSNSPCFDIDDVARLGLAMPSAVVAVPVYCNNAIAGVLELLKYQGKFDETDLRLAQYTADEISKILVAEKLRQRDSLTGIDNNEALHTNIVRIIRAAWRHEIDLSVGMSDLDHFGNVNNTYGHQAGDFALKEFVSLVQGSLHRPEDLIARYGGEEFVIVLPHTFPGNASGVFEGVRKTIDQHQFIYSGTEIPLTVSIGVSSLSQLECQYLLHFGKPGEDEQRYDPSPINLIRYYCDNHDALAQTGFDTHDFNSQITSYLGLNQRTVARTPDEVKNDLGILRQIMSTHGITPDGIIHDPNARAFVAAKRLLHQADLALYAAKHSGRNQVVLYNPSLG